MKEQKSCYHYKLILDKHLNNIKKIDLLYAANIKILSFSYDPIKKALENRIKDVDLPQIIKQPDIETGVVDFSKILEKLGDYHFVERKEPSLNREH